MRKNILALICVVMLLAIGCSGATQQATLKTTGPDFIKDQSHGPTETIVIEYERAKK